MVICHKLANGSRRPLVISHGSAGHGVFLASPPKPLKHCRPLEYSWHLSITCHLTRPRGKPGKNAWNPIQPSHPRSLLPTVNPTHPNTRVVLHGSYSNKVENPFLTNTHMVSDNSPAINYAIHISTGAQNDTAIGHDTAIVRPGLSLEPGQYSVKYYLSFCAD